MWIDNQTDRQKEGKIEIILQIEFVYQNLMYFKAKNSLHTTRIISFEYVHTYVLSFFLNQMLKYTMLEFVKEFLNLSISISSYNDLDHYCK